MAESWKVSADKLTYTFNIRDNAEWTNGDPVTAEDFVYAWKRMLDPKTGASSAFLGYMIKGGEEFNSGKGKQEDVKVTAKDKNACRHTGGTAGLFSERRVQSGVFPD